MFYSLPTGNGQPVAVTWPVGDFTGFYPTNLSATQAGVSNSWYGSDSVQLQNNELGLMIHPESIGGPNLTIYASTASYAWQTSQLPTPFIQANTILSYAIDIQVPQVYSMAPSSYAYASLYFLFQDQVSGAQFWYGADVFDNGRTGFDYVHIDQGYPGATGLAIVSGALGTTSQYLTYLGGASFQSSTWSGFQRFNFGMTAANLSSAIAAIQASATTGSPYLSMSTNPADYQLLSFNFNPEVADIDGASYGWIGSSARKIQVSTMNGGTFCNDQNYTVTWTCGGGTPSGSGWVSVGGGCYQLLNPNQPCN